MSTNINTNHDLKTISNELYCLRDEEERLKEKKKKLKVMMADAMGADEVYIGIHGIIKRISRKPKRIYDRDRLEAELEKRGISEDIIEDIVKQSTRRINVSEHLSVKVKRSK